MFERILSKMVDGAQAPDHPNCRYQLDGTEFAEAQTRLGFSLPHSIAVLATEIGCGFFRSSLSRGEQEAIYHVNRFLDPTEIADLLLGAGELTPSQGFASGEIPFFEVADAFFLVVRPTHELPDQVCWPRGAMISKSLVEFTESLSDNPLFYLE